MVNVIYIYIYTFEILVKNIKIEVKMPYKKPKEKILVHIEKFECYVVSIRNIKRKSRWQKNWHELAKKRSNFKKFSIST